MQEREGPIGRIKSWLSRFRRYLYKCFMAVSVFLFVVIVLALAADKKFPGTIDSLSPFFAYFVLGFAAVACITGSLYTLLWLLLGEDY